MSTNTKIIVLKSKELIYTGIFVVLGILLVLLIFYMFSPSSENDTDKDTSSQATTEGVSETLSTYKSGVYTSNLSLGGSDLTCTVTVDNGAISHVDISNLDETVSAMYPLLQPSLDDINTQLSMVSDIEDITFSQDNQYTTIIIMEAVKQALSAGGK